MTTQTGEPGAWIVYDGQCPFCSRYVALLRLRDSLGEVRLINARDGGPVVEELQRAGVDLDEGEIPPRRPQDVGFDFAYLHCDSSMSLRC